jgi:crotonobetainyl-CoA:carnitine CoA-transferase CaiB-like acyl-CoA transferase
MKEIYEGAIKRKVHLYPVSNTKELAENEQLMSRGFWKEIEHTELGETITYPGSFLKLSEVECGIRNRAPLIGEHNEEIFIDELGFSREDLKRLEREGVI